MKRIIGAAALSTGLVFGLATSASAAEIPVCKTVAPVYKVVTTPATPAVYKTVKVVDVEAKPATPGSEAVEEVSHFETRVVKEAYDEVVPATYKTVTVTIKEAYNEVVQAAVAAQHYSLKGNSGIGKYDVPVFPAPYWQANAKHEPHKSGNVTWLNADHTGLHYTSHGSKGNRDWFYFQPEVPEIVIHHDAVTETKQVIDVPEHTVHHDAVTEQVKVIDTPGKPAVPPTPAVEEVSHFEQVLVTPATTGTSKRVLVSTGNHIKCRVIGIKPRHTVAKPPVESPRPVASPQPVLAHTGSELQNGALVGGGLLGLGLIVTALRRRVFGS